MHADRFVYPTLQVVVQAVLKGSRDSHEVKEPGSDDRGGVLDMEHNPGSPIAKAARMLGHRPVVRKTEPENPGCWVTVLYYSKDKLNPKILDVEPLSFSAQQQTQAKP